MSDQFVIKMIFFYSQKELTHLFLKNLLLINFKKNFNLTSINLPQKVWELWFLDIAKWLRNNWQSLEKIKNQLHCKSLKNKKLLKKFKKCRFNSFKPHRISCKFWVLQPFKINFKTKFLKQYQGYNKLVSLSWWSQVISFKLQKILDTLPIW